MSGSLRRTVLAGAFSVLLGATLVQTVGTTSAGAVDFDPCRNWTFYLVTGSMQDSWRQAAATARRMGGKLAVIQSAAENACAAAATSRCGGCGVWIGGSDRVDEGVWRWDGGNRADARRTFYIGEWPLGSPMRGAFSGFRDGEPNGNTGENCATTDGSGGWNDLACGNVLPFLVEY